MSKKPVVHKDGERGYTWAGTVAKDAMKTRCGLGWYRVRGWRMRKTWSGVPLNRRCKNCLRSKSKRRKR